MRNSLIDLSKGSYDLLVIGGGINGAGIARDAALRGFRVLLVEKEDYAAFTSSRSTKLIHGGIRYLEQKAFKLVQESLHERRVLMDIAPNLVKELGFVIPFYQGDQRPKWQLKIGLFLYDFLAGSRNIKKHTILTAEEVSEQLPGIQREGLQGGALYWDCRVDDARLVLETILDAQRHGAKTINYAEVQKFLSGPDGINGVKVKCRLTQQEADISARVVVNVAGPWVNDLVKSQDPKHAPLIRMTKGVHLVIPKITKDHATLLFHQKDNRVFFVLPFNETHTYVGTTDTDYKGEPGEAAATEQDIQYLLQEVRRTFPGTSIKKEDVVSTWAGVRALVNHPGINASQVSREYRINQEQDGPLKALITVCGGKLTTYRALADKVVQHVAQTLNKHIGSETRTATLPLGGEGMTRWSDWSRAFIQRFEKETGLPESLGEHLSQRYGYRADQVATLIRENSALTQKISELYPYFAVEVIAAVRLEQAVTLCDVLCRRMPAVYLPGQGLDIAHQVAQLMANDRNWDAEEVDRQVKHYENEVKTLYPLPA